MKKPSVNVRPVADRYSLDGERVIEVSSNVGGCLISIHEVAGKLRINVYRADDTVYVFGGPQCAQRRVLKG